MARAATSSGLAQASAMAQITSTGRVLNMSLLMISMKMSAGVRRFGRTLSYTCLSKKSSN